MSEELRAADLFEKLVKGDRVSLGRAITLVESMQPAHRQVANELLDLCLQEKSKSFRFAISGSPGVGKSTMIETLGKHITDSGESLAVLAVDPTSRLSGGSIMGDKTRMATLSQDPKVYIRPSPAGDTPGWSGECHTRGDRTLRSCRL